MVNKACTWELVYTSSDKTLLTRIRLIKCVKCTKMNHPYSNCVVDNDMNKLLVIKTKNSFKMKNNDRFKFKFFPPPKKANKENVQ